MLQVTIWMNMPSFYQDGLFNALTACGDVELRVIFAKQTTQDRLQLGWKKEARNYPHRFLSSRFAFLDAVRIAWTGRGRLHVVNGIWAEPVLAVALCSLALLRSRFVVYAEAPDPRQAAIGFSGVLRKSFGAWIAKRALGMLAVSNYAEAFYTHLGFESERVLPFGYFRASDDWPQPATKSSGRARTEVIFVGQLIPRKGADLLLEAIQPLFGDYPDLFLSVIGAGIAGDALQSRARSLEITDRVNFEGTISSDRIQARLGSVDLLVLPSRWDGWGLVVNEALSAGVPVIVSDRCGAADLIQHGVNGFVFRSEDVEDLRRCLRRFLENADHRLAYRSAAASTGRALSAEAVAPYLIECLKHMTGASAARPAPPWAGVPASESASR